MVAVNTAEDARVQSSGRATESFSLPDELVAQLASIAGVEHATAVMALAASFALLLNRYSGQDDLLIAMPARENTVVVRAVFTDDLDFRSLLRQVRDRLGEPNVEHAPTYDLVLRVSEVANGLEGAFNYSTDLFEAETVRRLRGHFATLLESIVRDPDQSVRSLAMLTERERTQVLHDWNDTRAELPETCAHRLFEAQVARTPDATALLFEGVSLSYRELSERANRVASYLRRLGVGPEVLVGVCLGRSAELAVALLGVWKAGGAYVPLDPTLPKERLAFMLRDASAKVLLTRAEHRSSFDAGGPTFVCIDTDWPLIEKESLADVDSPVAPSNLAYVMYTSGSTGQPKGVMIVHEGLVNYLLWAKDEYEAGSGDAVPVHSSIAFDLTVTALFVPLVAGGRVEMLREDVGGQNLVASMRSGSGRSLVKITPAHLALLSERLGTEGARGRTKLFVIGGENLLAESLLVWRDHAPATRLINEYGPTETVVGCCVYEVAADDPRSGSVPIGRPIANTRLYVLDRHMNPLPPGIVGELYIGGAGVARGYLNRPELTTERFLPDPFSNETGARIYKTGDLARYRSDGILEYLGRLDNQVKVRGYRIELGEIEAKLADLPTVKSSAVLAREDTPGSKQLVGYVVPQGDARPTAEDLRRSLGTSLPEYMVPSQFVFLDAMPLTTNGKVDRRALPAPSAEGTSSGQARMAASTPTEIKLLAIWKEVLGLGEMGTNENFFELGGHSLQAIKVVSQIQEVFDVDLSPQELFDDPTIAGLAKAVERATGAAGR